MDHSKRKLVLWILLGVIISYIQSDFLFERQELTQSADTKSVVAQEEVTSASIAEEAGVEEVNSPSSVIPRNPVTILERFPRKGQRVLCS